MICGFLEGLYDLVWGVVAVVWCLLYDFVLVVGVSVCVWCGVWFWFRGVLVICWWWLIVLFSRCICIVMFCVCCFGAIDLGVCSVFLGGGCLLCTLCCSLVYGGWLGSCLGN